VKYTAMPARLCLMGVALACGALQAGGSGPANNAPPDWSGLWHTKGSVALISAAEGQAFVRGTADDAPLKPEFMARYKADAVRALEQGDPKATDSLTDSNTLHCFAGMPRFIATPFQYEFINTPKETYIIVDKAVRHIFTDGRDWPPEDARWPLMIGRSRGHWEGKTLVIETTDMRDDMWLDTTPLTVSTKAIVIERLTMVDHNTIENKVVIHDPVKFTRAWSFVRHYERRESSEWPDDPELCGGPDDRNPVVNGKVTTQLPGELEPKK
jgi:hypothetical protein